MKSILCFLLFLSGPLLAQTSGQYVFPYFDGTHNKETFLSPTSGKVLGFDGTHIILTTPTTSFGSLTGVPTSLPGYGITDAFPLTAAEAPGGIITVLGNTPYDTDGLFQIDSSTTHAVITLGDRGNHGSGTVLTLTDATQTVDISAPGGSGILTVNGNAVWVTGNTIPGAYIGQQMSITSDGSGLKLVNDAATPGNSKYYGTNGGGTLGYYALPAPPPSGVYRLGQISQAVKTDTMSSTASTFTTVTGLSITVTPAGTTSQFRIRAVVRVASDTGGNHCAFCVARNGTPVSLSDASGSHPQSMGSHFSSDEGGYGMADAVVEWIDSPATASAITYDFRCANFSGNGGNWYVNRGGNDPNSADGVRGVSVISVEEIIPN